MKRAWFTNLFLLIAGLVFVFAVLEIFFRSTHFLGARISWAESDRWLGWRMAPGTGYVYVHENDQPVSFRVNSWGWRGPEWTQEKTAGSLRIAVLGDSYVEALQVEEQATFLHLLQTRLTEKLKKPVELMNFGRSCNTQSEELLILEREVLDFKPDLVVLFYFAVNDIGDLDPSTALTLMRPFYHRLSGSNDLRLDTSFNETREFKLKELINPLKRNSAFISLLTERLIILQRTQQAHKIGLLGGDANEQASLKAYLSLATRHPESAYVKNYALSKELIKRMQAVCQKKGIGFMLVNIDLPSYLPETEILFKKADPSFDPSFFDRDLGHFAAAHGIVFIGLDSIFRQSWLKNQKPLHFKYWDTLGTRGYWEYGAHTGHWNYAGHRLVAETLEEPLTQQLRRVIS